MSSPELESFLVQARWAPLRLLFLDYDGTLAPFVTERDKAFPYPEIAALLPKLRALPRTRMILVSGRPVADFRNLLAMAPLPEIWGSHGWEHLAQDGVYEPPQLDAETRRKLDEARRAMEVIDLPNICEVKPASVAVHWRGLSKSEKDEIRRWASRAWEAIAQDAPLELCPFESGLELRALGRNKGDAIRDVLLETPTGTAAAYLGDDVTDEDAFRALRRRGLRVLVRESWRPTEADVWIRPPEEVVLFLQRFIEVGSNSDAA